MIQLNSGTEHLENILTIHYFPVTIKGIKVLTLSMHYMHEDMFGMQCVVYAILQ